MKATIHVRLKKEVLDPQGEAVHRALVALGFDAVKNVRVGKLVELELAGDSQVSAEAQLKAMCEKLLANPVIEDFHFETHE